jgi:phage gp29-like protein
MAENNLNLPAQSGQEIGASGTYFFRGYITAEEYSIDLQGKYGLQVYDVMRKSDPTVHTILNVCKQPILSADWDIETASDDPKDVEIADRARYEFFNRNITFTDLMREGLTFLDFGFFIAELVFEKAEFDGKLYIGVKKVASRKQRSILKFELDNKEPGITQILPKGGMAEIPRSKLIYVVNDQEGENYFGISMLRYVYKPWKIKDSLEIMNAVALENAALGTPYIKKGINNETTAESELAKVRTLLRQQRANEEGFIEYPASIEVGWFDKRTQSTKDVMPTIQYYDHQITLSVLAQFLMLGSFGGSGSRATSEDHSALFTKALKSVARLWQQAFQRDILNRWVDLNYSDLPNGYPKLVFNNIADNDITAISNAISSLVTSGAIRADRDMENRLRVMMSMPEISEEDYENYAEITKAKANGMPVDAADDKEDESKGSPDNPDDDKTGKELPEADPNDKTKADRQKILNDAREAQKKVIELLARG